LQQQILKVGNIILKVDEMLKPLTVLKVSRD